MLVANARRLTERNEPITSRRLTETLSPVNHQLLSCRISYEVQMHEWVEMDDVGDVSHGNNQTET
jgi:hypothetical protein